ncbi:23S rRNA (guanosine(2251)-2'-O)-methyltransferase RlmB [Fodinicola acaciae]|uniref:23S rRNA (guanosine(2251)-2'-O)-methyltransferase RlmB n=1 Tax=Fodinicola acaciae TaxID=2681555 RepID=UPI0013D8B88C|nr:23S rRNA (guanosine(2251)-2'-O)-methyltransferase RlmB [Fodinicola acaciae]
MPGNSQPRNRRSSNKKGATKGTGGHSRKKLEGKGPTPKAVDRTGHPARRKANAAKRAAASRAGQPARPRTAPGRRSASAADAPELLVGRNPVAEALAARIPATALYVALGIDSDERVTTAIQLAADRGLSILEISRAELDRMTGGVLHQGIGLQVPPFQYAELDDVLAAVDADPLAGLLVALDGVTDPRNLGAVIRSAGAFGAHGLVLPARRSAGVTATAWRTSAGAAARLPVAKVTNLVRALNACKEAGFTVVGLDAAGEVDLDHFAAGVDPVVVVVGSEGKGLSRLVSETCDLRISIPMASGSESLNASIAAAVTLAEIARQRRV